MAPSGTGERAIYPGVSDTPLIELGTRASDTYIVLVDILAADAFDAELIHAHTNGLANGAVTAAGSMRSVDFIGVLNLDFISIVRSNSRTEIELTQYASGGRSHRLLMP